MQSLNCVIIDDEPLSRKGLKEYINDIDFLNLAGEYDNPIKASADFKNINVQLLFLDIQMPKISGIEFFKSMHHAPPVIFTTAFPQYALDGFDLNALDYLVKPISFDRFFKAALKAKEYYEVREENQAEASPPNSNEKYFFIKADNKLIKIFFDDILFVEALQNYVNIQTKDKKYVTWLTFKSIEEYLPADEFLKCHKSFIVAASKVSSIHGNEIIIGNHHIPISRNAKEESLSKLLKGRFLKR
ncbi:MAG: LytR/AlgR family response regulator transcription factor [Chitinophagaceae bacterium]